MRKIALIYTLTIVMLLTSCGAKKIENNLPSNETTETTVEYVTNNETIATTSQPKVVTQLISNNTQIQLSVGQTVQLTYSILPENINEEYRDIEWVSTDSTIGCIDENGNLTGVENGMCTIVATSKNNPDIMLKYSVTVSGGSNILQVLQGTTIYISTTEFTTTTIATTTPSPTDTSQDTEPPQDDIQISDSISSDSITSTEIQPTYIDNILIVNKKHPLPSSYIPSIDFVEGEYSLISEVQYAFENMSNDAINNGLSLNINSGYISYDEQSMRYQNAISNYGQDYANQYVDQPGYSESQTGLSILLNSADESFDNTLEASWIAENCYKYGFIVRYPQGKQDSTGKSYRSYQIRYVGVDIATQMYNQNLSLEEYLGV